jgi:ketosteroid isomerase-like protein
MYSVFRWSAWIAMACTASAVGSQVPTESRGEAQIRRRDSAWEDAVQAKDFSKVLAFYTEDCAGLFTSLPVALGKSAMGDLWHRILSRQQLSLHWKPTHIEVARSGELAYDFGSMTLNYVDDKGAAVNFVGKYVVVWKKESDGQWRVALDASNPDTAHEVRYNQ